MRATWGLMPLWIPDLPGALLSFIPPTHAMSLIPRWRYMTDEAKGLTQRSLCPLLSEGAADPPDLKTAKGKGDQTQLDISPVEVLHQDHLSHRH